ncbi:DUF2270 domain-containing protein [Aggregicoccus sp. 17bor-14]|uniref:DUF2270 domain-containing protein n=1 Tax=Myxococcaceae TaxID=31 RepID=UPI00129C4954|nr:MULTISPECIES: DUF2270 domain-containing protein [Myxococcaceae]MBF5042457.1 DUF2270 domain-containing protein [Simulacricoccus sp. 17bor-14]MRI88228.1 DUF2270 domain-containing protein [Aggregicoccus sp. 17bor-14]
MGSSGRGQNELSERGAERLSDQTMVQLYRGELGRADRWRTRLDTTTNWAITTTAAVISFGFASPASPHAILLVGLWMVVTFLLIEARRYRYYDLWNRRTRLLEDGFWAPKLRHEPVDPDAMRELAIELERPQITLSLFSAISTRLNRAYGPIFLVLLLAWFVKVYTHPAPPEHFQDFVARAHIGPVPGWFVMATVTFLCALATFLFANSFLGRAPLGELRTRPRGPRRALLSTLVRPYAVRKPRRQGGPRRVGPPPPPPSTPPITH